MTILLADDHELYRDSIKLWLETLGGLGDDRRIETAASYAEVVAFLEGNPLPRLLMLDLCMPGMNGVESIQQLLTQWSTVPVLVVSANDDPLVIKGCIEAGAAGFLAKSVSGKTMLQAIRQVLEKNNYIPNRAMDTGLPHFSHKQMEILHILAEGCSNRDIARRAHLSEGTVKQYLSNIMQKLDVENRVQAAIRARQILGLSS